ncbi:hypothetical protein HID58_077496, partial [Brassica napus]
LSLSRTRHLSRQFRKSSSVNVTPVPTYKTHPPDDDVSACVPITKQPASDNPFLKNHKIQMKPNYYPEGFFDDNKVSSTKSGKERHTYPSYGGKCFEGTIPMRRTKEDDFLRASSFKKYGKKKE